MKLTLAMNPSEFPEANLHPAIVKFLQTETNQHGHSKRAPIILFETL